MALSTAQQRRENQQLARDALARHQLARLNQLLDAILPDNALYAEKLAHSARPIESLEQLAMLPFTTKEELVATGDGWAANRTYPVQRYVRFHQTSGTRGRPMAVVDTSEDWQWWIEGWQYVLDAAEITSDDVCLMAFSFGPFIGFWSAFDAAAARGCLVIPGGGLSTVARLERASALGATCVFCTPSYALRMAEVAAENDMDVGQLPVRRLVLAGEPGGSLPAVRGQIEKAWDATVLDHSGASEIGPWGYGDLEGKGLYVNEAEFIAEFFSIESGDPAAEGELSEIVLTTLGRAGCPVIRYRTGDLVRPTWKHDGDVSFVRLDGGVLGRVDDMMIIRGVNIYPTSVEQILRSFPEVAEYRLTAYKESAMDQLLVEIEDALNEPDRVAKQLQLRLGLNIAVKTVAPGTLPRFEAKGNRFVDNR